MHLGLGVEGVQALQRGHGHQRMHAASVLTPEPILLHPPYIDWLHSLDSITIKRPFNGVQGKYHLPELRADYQMKIGDIMRSGNFPSLHAQCYFQISATIVLELHE